MRRPSGTCATPLETIACGGTPTSGSASSVVVARVGGGGPEMVLSVVVFPAPLLPRIVTISPRPTSSPTPFGARISPEATPSQPTLTTARPRATGTARAQVVREDPRVALDVPRGPFSDPPS